MAFDYDGANGGVFTHLGKFIKHIDLTGTDGTNLAADQDEIIDALDAGDQDTVVQGIAPQFDSWRREFVQRRQYLAGKCLARLQDRVTVLLEIGAISSEQAEILTKLVRRMLIDSETINASAVVLGTVTAGAGNQGNGTFLLTKVLDGFSSPGQLAGVQFPAMLENNGLETELCVPSETMSLVCVGDSFRGNAQEGQESWAWEGRIADEQFGILGDGSGSIGTVTASNLLINGDFETFSTADEPDGWEIEAGTPGTHIEEQAAGADVYHGDFSLKLTGDGALAAITFSQATFVPQLNATRRYAVHVRVKADATISAGTLTIQFVGTGYTAGTDKIEVAHGALPTSWTLYSFFATIPAEVPSDFKLSVSWGSTPTNAKSLWIDDVWLQPANYGGGIGIVPVRGSIPFIEGDRFTWTVANTEGIFQRFFRRQFGVQLPSNAAAGETIADSLAT